MPFLRRFPGSIPIEVTIFFNSSQVRFIRSSLLRAGTVLSELPRLSLSESGDTRGSGADGDVRLSPPDSGDTRASERADGDRLSRPDSGDTRVSETACGWPSLGGASDDWEPEEIIAGGSEDGNGANFRGFPVLTTAPSERRL